MSKHTFFGTFEDKVVFTTSRSFFLFLVVLAALGTAGGILYGGYGVTPTKKPITPLPAAITPTDLQQGVIASDLHHDMEQEQNQPGIDTNQVWIDAYRQKVDSLRWLMPEPTYSWENKQVPIRQGNYTRYENVTGIHEYVRWYERAIDDWELRVHGMRNLLSLLRTYGESQRLEPLQKFMNIYRMRAHEYERIRAKDAAAYEKSVETKGVARKRGLYAVGTGIAFVAVLGIFLVLLAIQRDMRRLVEQNAPKM